jgi:hypothetical protein
VSVSRLRASIDQLPTWPALSIAAVLALGIASWFYVPTYQRCHELKESREALRAAIEAAGRAGTALDLAAVLPGTWDEVRIAQGHRLDRGQRPYHCPFNWDLTREQRRALIASGEYTLIGFFESGQFQRYIEYRGDWARFEGEVDSIGRADARFRVGQSSFGPAVLTPARP